MSVIKQARQAAVQASQVGFGFTRVEPGADAAVRVVLEAVRDYQGDDLWGYLSDLINQLKPQ